MFGIFVVIDEGDLFVLCFGNVVIMGMIYFVVCFVKVVKCYRKSDGNGFNCGMFICIWVVVYDDYFDVVFWWKR